jgi:hypothetical protein
MPPPEDEPRTWAPRERTMLAAVRNVAWGAAMVMAGLLAVIVANCIWMAYFRLDVAILSGPRVGEFCMFCDTTWASLVELIRANSIIGLAVVIWPIAFAIRRASRSISAHRSFP